MDDVYFLAIDAGTTRIKAGLFSETGHLLDLVKADVEIARPFEGACEVDMDVVWQNVCRLLRDLMDRNAERWTRLSGVGVTGQGDGLWPVDSSGKAVRNAILWNDTRTKHLLLEEGAALEQFCLEKGMTPLFPGAGPLLLKWIKTYEPDHFRRTARVLHCKDWINLKLTGRATTDYSDASTALLDVLNKEYVFELLPLLGLEGCAELFPPTYSSTNICGVITSRAAAETGVPAGVPVIGGAIDVAAVAAGTGAVNPGQALTIVGTTLCNELVLNAEQVDHRDPRGSVLCHLVPERYLRVMATSNGTAVLDWARQTFAPGLPFAEIERGMASLPVGSDGVLFHPYFYGERAPFKNASARGGFYGLSAQHTPMHLLRAVYEGLALSLYDCYQSLPQVEKDIYIAGGGAASDFLCQMAADCLGRSVVRPAAAELGLNGIAQALCATFSAESLREHASAVPPEHIFTPDLKKHGHYVELYVLFVQMRKASEDYWLGREKRLQGLDIS